ncbi:MAG: ABC transporter ATP-binding protein [Xanthomonadales bacterium]|nr:ABC transporter ATP-binding protein [Xanthomonadales bacterium]
MNTLEQTSRTPLLEVRDLSLSFHQQEQIAIDHVSLSITQGNTLGLVGASGAGKSSVARAILQLVKPDSGEILFKGEEIHRMNPQELKTCRQRIQLVFQEPSASLSPRRTVEQTLLEPLQHFAIGDASFQHEKALHILDTVGLDQSALRRYPHQFSSGQQQRIAIARALITDPELLIADEAVSSLDVSIQAQILQLIQKLQKDFGITFLFISHDLAVIRQIADDVAVMYQGQLLEQSSADRFFSEPAHPYSKTLLSFAQGKAPTHRPDDKRYLERNRRKAGDSSACLFAGFCPEKMQVCERVEPAIHDIQHKNQGAPDPHCVKCHLYNEVNANDFRE